MPHLHRISFVPVIPLRFERRTHALEGRCSIQLSYGTIPVICKAFSDSAAIRTQDPRLRRALLYPAELRNHPLSYGTILNCGAKVCFYFELHKLFGGFMQTSKRFFMFPARKP